MDHADRISYGRDRGRIPRRETGVGEGDRRGRESARTRISLTDLDQQQGLP
jgi:hypothetical protein